MKTQKINSVMVGVSVAMMALFTATILELSMVINRGYLVPLILLMGLGAFLVCQILKDVRFNNTNGKVDIETKVDIALLVLVVVGFMYMLNI